MRVHVYGPPNVGKTAVAIELASRLQIPWVSLGKFFRAADHEGVSEVGQLPSISVDGCTQGGEIEIHIGQTNTRHFSRATESSNYEATRMCRSAATVERLLNELSKILPSTCVVEGRPARQLIQGGDPILVLFATREERSRRLQNTPTAFESVDISVEKRAIEEGEIAWLGLSDAYDCIPYIRTVDTTNLNLNETVNEIERLIAPGRNVPVAVAIPAHNPGPQLTLKIQSLLTEADTRGYDLGVCIVDDGSTEWPNIVKDSRVTVIRLPHHSRSHARNSAVGALSAEAGEGILCFLDSEGIPARNFLSRTLTVHANNIPGQITIGPRRRIIKSGTIRPDSRQRLMQNIGIDPSQWRYPWMLAYTANVTCNIELAAAITFEEQLLGWGLEDVDWAYRAISHAGAHLVWDEERFILDPERDGTGSGARFAEWELNRNILQDIRPADETEVIKLFQPILDPKSGRDYIKEATEIHRPDWHQMASIPFPAELTPWAHYLAPDLEQFILKVQR